MSARPQLDYSTVIEDEALRLLARRDFKVFCEYAWRDNPRNVTPMTDAQYVDYVLKKTGVYNPDLRFFHNEIADILQSNMPRVHIEAPREHAKTTLVSVKYPLFELGRNPNMRILICSRTAMLAQHVLRECKQNIEMNDKLKAVFPRLQQSLPWSEKGFIVKRPLIDKALSMRGVGLHGSLTGDRADMILLDDPFDENETRSTTQREKIVEFIEKIVIPLLSPTGKMVAIGTRWHYADYWGNLLEKRIEKGGMYYVKVYQAINHVDPQDDNSPTYELWPKVWDDVALQRRHAEIGTIRFNCLYQNDPRGMEGLTLKDKWLHYYRPDDIIKFPQLQIFIGVDPAISENPESDNTALVAVAFIPDYREIWLLDIFADHLDFPAQIAKIREWSLRTNWPGLPDKWQRRPLKIGIESVAYQKVLHRTTYLMGMPVVEVKVTHSKEDRMISLSPHFENGRIKLPDPAYVHTPWLPDFLSEYREFPRGRREDRLDGLDIAFSLVDLTPPAAFAFGPP